MGSAWAPRKGRARPHQAVFTIGWRPNAQIRRPRPTGGLGGEVFEGGGGWLLDVASIGGHALSNFTQLSQNLSHQGGEAKFTNSY